MDITRTSGKRVNAGQGELVTAGGNQTTVRKSWKALAAVVLGLGFEYPGLAKAQFDFTTIDVPGATATAVNANSTHAMGRGLLVRTGIARGFVLNKGVFTTIDFPGAVATVVNPDVTIVTTVNGINAPRPVHWNLRRRHYDSLAPTPVKPAGGDAFGQAARDFSGRDGGDWEGRREEVGERVVNSIARFTTNLPEAIIDSEIMGPPDIEREVGLTGGHISGRMPATVHVGSPPGAQNADARRIPLRRLHPPRRQRDRHQRSQCGNEDPMRTIDTERLFRLRPTSTRVSVSFHSSKCGPS